MIPIRGNALGLAMLVVTGAIAGIGSLLFKLPDAVVMISVGGALLVMDVLIRLRARPATGWLTQSQFGGFLFIAPVWAIGVFVMGANVLAMFLG